MTLAQIPGRLYESVRFRFRKYILPIGPALALGALNHLKRDPITAPGGPSVSLTTHGIRIKNVHIAIESIARGKVLPSELILWLDDERLFKNLPPAIERLKKRGLDVRLCSNYGPHTKYYPYVESKQTFDVPLVTADDDQLYPSTWLEGLVAAHRAYPDVVNANWSVTLALGENGIEKYNNWTRCGSTTPSFSQFALGVSGVIYPPALLERIKAAGTAFKECCPKADDVWLHAQALRAGYKIRQIAATPREHLDIVGTQSIALWRDNNHRANNDLQVEKTYGPDDIKILRSAQSHNGI